MTPETATQNKIRVRAIFIELAASKVLTLTTFNIKGRAIIFIKRGQRMLLDRETFTAGEGCEILLGGVAW